ncbi:hypothetical protein RI367_002745 [Sorochytrium milnesiophthora]
MSSPSTGSTFRAMLRRVLLTPAFIMATAFLGLIQNLVVLGYAVSSLQSWSQAINNARNGEDPLLAPDEAALQELLREWHRAQAALIPVCILSVFFALVFIAGIYAAAKKNEVLLKYYAVTTAIFTLYTFCGLVAAAVTSDSRSVIAFAVVSVLFWAGTTLATFRYKAAVVVEKRRERTLRHNTFISNAAATAASPGATVQQQV